MRCLFQLIPPSPPLGWVGETYCSLYNGNSQFHRSKSEAAVEGADPSGVMQFFQFNSVGYPLGFILGLILLPKTQTNQPSD